MKESENDTKRQTKRTLETFLREGLELDPNAIKLEEVHQLPQRPLKKAGKKKTRPIIFKVSMVFEKDIIFENISKLKDYNNDRASTVFITEHLSKSFYVKTVSNAAVKRRKKR